MDQAHEQINSSESASSQLREQISRMELRVLKEIDSHQAKELKCRKLEVSHRSLTVSHGQLEEELLEMKGRLQGECESKVLQESLYKEQTKMCELLRTESVKGQKSKNELFSKLKRSESSRQGWLF